MDCMILKKFSLKVLVHIFKAKPKMYHGLLFSPKIDRCLSPKFKGNARLKVRKKDFCIILAVKQQKCLDRAPLKSTPFEHASI